MAKTTWISGPSDVRSHGDYVNAGNERQFVPELPAVRLQADLDAFSSGRSLGLLQCGGSLGARGEDTPVNRAELLPRVQQLLGRLRCPRRAIRHDGRTGFEPGADVSLPRHPGGGAQAEDVKEALVHAIALGAVGLREVEEEVSAGTVIDP